MTTPSSIQVAELVKHLMFLFGVETVPKDKFNQAADCLESLMQERDEASNRADVWERMADLWYELRCCTCLCTEEKECNFCSTAKIYDALKQSKGETK